MSYEEEDTCMSHEEEDTCMSYEEEDTCVEPGVVVPEHSKTIDHHKHDIRDVGMHKHQDVRLSTVG